MRIAPTIQANSSILRTSNVSMKLYPNDRHEILNEDNRENVYRDVLTWINGTLA